MDLFEAAREWISSRVRPEDDNSAVSTHAGLRAALGCRPKLIPIAYWEYRDLDTVLREATVVLGGDSPQFVWDSVTERTWPAVAARLQEASTTSPIEVPPQPTLRPWVDPKLTSTGTIPFVPIAAVCHLALSASSDAPLSEVLASLNFGPSTDPWAMLDRVDPLIVTQDPPEGVEGLTKAIIQAASTGPQIAGDEHWIEPRTPAQMLVHAAQFECPVGELQTRLERIFADHEEPVS